MLARSTKLSLTVLALVFAFGIPTAQAQVPWDEPDAVCSNYIYWRSPKTGSDNSRYWTIWDMVHNKKVTQVKRLQRQVHLVPGHPRVVVLGPNGPTGRPLARSGLSECTLSVLGSDLTPPRMEISPSSAYKKKSVMVNRNRAEGPYLSADLGRVIYFQKGDLWSGSVDWGAGTIVNRRQVTQLGMFGVGKPIIHWYGDRVFVMGNFSQDKPIVRIDLNSGDVSELTTMHIFNRKSFASPDARYVAATLDDLLNVYDLATNETFRISLRPVQDKMRTPRLKRRGAFFTPSGHAHASGNILWLDDVRALSWASDALAIVNLEEKSVRTLLAPEDPTLGVGRVDEARLLPGGGYVLLAIAYDQNGSHEQSVLRMSLDDASTVPLPSGVVERRYRLPNATWLDADRFIVAKQRGGLSEMGTWLYDLGEESSRRVCSKPATIRNNTVPSNLAKAYYCQAANALYFHSPAQGGGMVRAALEGDSSCNQVAAGVHHPGAFEFMPESYISDAALASLDEVAEAVE